MNIKTKPLNIEKVQIIKQYLKCSYLTALIISNRIKNPTYKEIDNFLNPSLKDNWLEITQIPNIKKLANEIQKIIQNKKTIGIIGDYDVDGLTSCTILIDFFKYFNIKTEIWIPSRNNGYGPNFEAADFFNMKKIETVFTLDCGTTAFEFAKHFHGEIIVIDHHPANQAIKGIIINPNIISENNINAHQNLKELSAAGLTFFVIAYILKLLNCKNYQNILTSFLDLVTLSTICDMMPINPLNKALINKGLKEIDQQKRIGLSQLINLAKLKLPTTARDIGFSIGPRLNAAGRIDSPKLALDLLLAKNPKDVQDIIYKLEQTNNYRREIQTQIFQEAIIEARKSNKKIVCLANEKWNLGVVGVVAAMIQNEINKPVIIANINNKIIKGSARSNTLNIGILIEKALEKQILTSGGGHKNAAGITCSIEQWEYFKTWINDQVFDNIIETLLVDAKTTLNEINQDYKMLAPFGINNPNPLILIENLLVIKIIDKISYFHIILHENFKPYTFFINKTETKTIQNLLKSHENKSKISCIIELNEKTMQIKCTILK